MGSLWLAAAIRTEVYARLHRPRRAAADRDLGRHHPRGLRQPPRRAVAVDLPEPRDPDRHDRAQPDRRRPARRDRSEDAAMTAVAEATAPCRDGARVRARRDHGRGADRVDPHRRPVVRRRARRELRGTPPRDAGARRRIRLRQEPHRAVDHGPAAGRRRPHLGRPHRRRRRRHDGGRRGRQAGDARRPHRHDLPGADDQPEPGAAGRLPDRGSARRAPRHERAGRRRRGRSS